MMPYIRLKESFDKRACSDREIKTSHYSSRGVSSSSAQDLYQRTSPVDPAINVIWLGGQREPNAILVTSFLCMLLAIHAGVL